MDIRGEYRFSSLVKQNKKAKICFVIHIAGEKKLLFYIYFVIVKQVFINGPLITTPMLCCLWDTLKTFFSKYCLEKEAISLLHECI
jgi:hypothetical protein